MNTFYKLLKVSSFYFVLFLPFSLIAQQTYIQIESEADVAIFLDKTFIGKTNVDFGGLIIENVSPGEHTIKAIKEGFLPLEKQITVNSGEVYNYAITQLIPKIRISESGKRINQEIGLKSGDLRITSFPVSLTIIIPSLGINYKKTYEEWNAEEVPVGQYPVYFVAGKKTILDTILINTNSLTQLFVNMVTGEISDSENNKHQQLDNSIKPQYNSSSIQNRQENYFLDNRDGKTYKTIRIGDQTWMAENLAYLPIVNKDSAGTNQEERFYVYNYSGTSLSEAKETYNYDKFGVLYNWLAAKEACPNGWHLPSDAEWMVITEAAAANLFNTRAITEDRDIGNFLASTSDWKNSPYSGAIGYNPSRNNSSGFNAQPGGQHSNEGGWNQMEKFAFFWSSSAAGSNRAWYRYLFYNYSGIYRFPNYQGCGFSVRCILD
jgi:uncharacterized protein (TIGR02145 family)